MTRQFRILALATLALTGAGYASASTDGDLFVRAPSADTRACFRVGQIDGVSVSSPIGPDQQAGVYLRVFKDVYQLELTDPCPTLDDSVVVGVQSRLNTGYICAGGDAQILTRSRLTSPATCNVSGVRKLTAAELAQVPQNQRP